MYSTIEVRWFLPGRASIEMRRWFERGAIAPTAEGLREDWYLVSPENAGLGIKLREARLEIKQRLARAGVHQLAQKVQGQVENWVKWEFALDAENYELPQFNQSDGFWVLVKKVRLSKRYSTEAEGVTPIAATAWAEQGCTLELTELQVWERKWHSLGLETFGDIVQGGQSSMGAEIPQRLMQHVLTDFHPTLKASDSFGYPQWLQKILNELG